MDIRDLFGAIHRRQTGRRALAFTRRKHFRSTMQPVQPLTKKQQRVLNQRLWQLAYAQAMEARADNLMERANRMASRQKGWTPYSLRTRERGRQLKLNALTRQIFQYSFLVTDRPGYEHALKQARNRRDQYETGAIRTVSRPKP